MNRHFIINILVFLCYARFYVLAGDWSSYTLNNAYPQHDTSNCVFPFTYNKVTYNDCTNIDNDYGHPWCSLTSNYIGLYAYCYDYRQPAFQCLDSYKSGSKNYQGCAYLSTTAMYRQCMTNSADVPKMYCDVNTLTKKSGKPYIHLNQCIDPKYNLSTYPTMCIGPSDYAIPQTIDSGNQSEIADMHNYYRSQVTSANMMKIYWDDELAKLAQAHSDLCAFDHDLASNRLTPVYGWLNGQNMMQASDFRTSLASLVDMMLGSEKPNFQYGTGCKDGGNCLHYSQAMISDLTRFGCGHTHCLYPDRLEHILVCNYIKSQYTDTYSTPWVQSSTAGSSCPSNVNGGLCDCGNKICDYNKNQVLNPDTCQCNSAPSKRSVDEENSNAEDLTPRVRPFHVRPPQNEDSDSDEIKKRSVNLLPKNDIVKRGIRQIIKFK